MYMRNPHSYALLGLPWCLLDTMGVPSALVSSGLWHIHSLVLVLLGLWSVGWLVVCWVADGLFLCWLCVWVCVVGLGLKCFAGIRGVGVQA